MGIRKGLKRYLLEKGFCRERGGKTFFRLLVDDFYVCVELHYERRPAYQIVPNHWLEIKAPFYDLKFDVLCLNERCMEGLNLSLLYMTRKKIFRTWVAFLRFAAFVENKSRIGSSIRKSMKCVYKEKS